MRYEQSLLLDPDELREQVDAGAFARGQVYARQGRVGPRTWCPEQATLSATVAGSTGRSYLAVARFADYGDGALEFEEGWCTCPVEWDCKHVVAMLCMEFAVAEQAAAAPAVAAPHWANVLDGALSETPQAAVRTGAVPLAVGLELITAYGGGFGLGARAMRPGKKGWVAGELNWGSFQYGGYQYEAEQVALLRELYALYCARPSPGYPYYGTRSERTIDLATIGSRALWPILTDLVAAGVALVGVKGQRQIAAPAAASLSLDVRAEDGGGLALYPVLRVGGQASDWTPVLFTPGGHGAVLVDPAVRTGDPAGWPLRLVSLPVPAPEGLTALFANPAGLRVPAEQVDAFRSGYCPRLARMVELTSTDASFAPPAIEPPTLVLDARYGAGHELELSWTWEYLLDGAPRRVGQGPDGFRDPAAERRILAEIGGPLQALPAEPGRPLALAGLDTMRFSTEVLPLLRDTPGVAVELAGTAADYREVGESLRVGLSTAEIAGDNDWFDLGVSLSVDGVEVPLAQVFTALAQNQDHLLLPDGGYFSLHKPQLLALRRLIEEARALAERPDGPLRIGRFQAGLWEELCELGVVDSQATAWRRQVDGLLHLSELPAPPCPAGLNAELRPYQLTGFQWLSFLWENGLGGVLADDMGLGKTLQALALIVHARERAPQAEPFLIVAPTSVVSNWAAEAARFAPGLRVVELTDTLRRRGVDLAEIVEGADVVVTSYTLFRLDIDAHAARGWSGLLLDEAQFAKNHRSQAYACARRLAAPFKLAITGTPLENNLMELWALLSIGAPGLFPHPTRFAETYAKPIESRTPGGEGPERLAALRRRIRPLMLRRTKEAVAAELPAKSEQILDVDLHPTHRRIYDRRLARERAKVLGLLEDIDRNRLAIFRSLTTLRQLSLHAGLVEPDDLAVPSAKIDTLVEHLAEVAAGGHRALVFSQFTGFLGLVRERLSAEGVEVCYLDGKTRNRARQIEAFRAGAAPVFLISLKAGGFGLNLTEADYVFLLDPWWNPAAEAQAIDRTHRIGQTRTVHVYRMIAADTIEAKVRALAVRKAELFADVMDDDGAQAFAQALTADQVRDLFS
ncbi:MAG: DEAD/DEAH box helicase [Sporichthyaceae bacterium]